MKLLNLVLITALIASSCQNARPDASTQVVPDTLAAMDEHQPIKEEQVVTTTDRIADEATFDDDQTKAYVLLSKGDSVLHLQANIRKDHQLYGYEKADLQSKKLILFSIFTSDVDNNPHQLPLGAYYETSGLARAGFKLTYKRTVGDFVETSYSDGTHVADHVVFFEQKFVTLE